MVSREELLDRWRGIEEEDDDQDGGDSSPSKRRMIRQLKERWFSDTFNFLIGSPVETHLWCGFWDLMGPLLETFHGYFKDKKPDSPLKLVWRRVSGELRQCTQCICQHHQAQETYNAEYESETVGPLLKVLQCLDEERVSEHLQEINARVSRGAYDPESHGAEVVSIMFEVLMFPTLLDDQSLVIEFERFIEAIDNSHELSLAGHQQYPGVYALLFLKNSRARAIGLRLAGCLGKLRKATDLEPLQPLLRKCMIILETEVLPANLDSSRPRVRLERVTAWLGLKALLGCLESPAFEEGILERHPIFLSTVLNHVSDDTAEFSYAVTCLRLFFEMLGCKLWLRTSISPSMMRNTLLGQCFHTVDEKSHKEIFDLFLPFLQSLESLQDGEHEKQRRHFLYFLLHQVTHSRNFSGLIRKNACKIALLIIQRGYLMNPPCPPFECSHMWGPSLVSSLKDISLHNSLRQPALDLIQTIIVSDCAALASIQLKFSSTSSGANAKIFSDLYDEDEFCLSHGLQENSSCWNAFCFQSKIAAEAYKDWKCIPLLWLDVFVGIDPLVLPISFSKAVIWVLSHFSFFDSDNNMESKLFVSEWLSSYAGEISNSFIWEVPTGGDDGGDGKVSKSSVNASLMCIPLIRAFKRCAVHYIIVMEQRELQKQWTWEPRMAESLILLLISPNDTARRVNRIILEHVSKTHGLTSGLQFLCSNVSSLSSMYMGLKYATMQVQVDCNSSIFCNLHHLFFVVRKLLKEVVASPRQPLKDFEEELTQIGHLKLSSEGGFLRKPCSFVSPVRVPGHSSSLEDVKSWDKFCFLISAIVWPSILKCLVEGKRFIDSKNCQMTCVRLLEILPVLFERVNTSWPQHSQSLEFPTSGFSNVTWLVDLVDWGKSSLVVVIRHWKQSILQLMNLLRNFHGVTECTIDAIEKFMSYDTIVVDDLKERLSQFSFSLPKKASCTAHEGSSKTAPSVSAASCFGREAFAAELSIHECKGLHLDDLSVTTADKVDNREKDMVVILSDDESEKMPTPSLIFSPSFGSVDERNEVYVDKSNLTVRRHDHQESVTVHAPEDTMEHSTITKVISDSRETSFQESNDVQSNIVSSKLLSIAAASLVNSSSDPGKQETKKPDPALGSSFGIPVIHKNAEQSLSSRKINAHKSDSVIKEVASVTNDNALDLAVTSARHSSSLLTKPLISVPKRKVVRLQMPMNNKVGQLSRADTGSRSFRPPRLDDWYRPILELDYFSLVGSYSGKEENITAAPSLKAVPLCFHSKDHYVEIFRPLVLEEFKAQMHSSYVEASSSEDMCCGILCVISVERIDDFHLVRGSPKCESSASRDYSENDLVLLTKEPLHNSSQPLHALGKVERRERNNKTQSTILSIRVYFQSALPRLVKMKKFLIERSKWHISRIMSITPQLREFQALSSLNNIPLLPLILNPTDSTSSYAEPRKAEIDKLPEPMQRTLKSSFNISQIQAISAAIRSQGPTKAFELSLIQGPPGTGKTRTIVAIVSALLAVGSSKSVSSKAFNNSSSSHDAAFINPRAQLSQTAAVARAWQDAALAKQITEDEVKAYSGAMPRSLKRRVLIGAQSNAAVDELVSRINSGLCGSDGKIYKPFLVRVGNVKTVHPNSLPFFIDTLVEQRLAEDNSAGDRKRDVDVDSSMLRNKLEKIVDSIRLYESKRAKARDSDMEMKSLVQDGTSKVDDVKELSDAEMGAKLNTLYAQKKSICGDIATAQARERKSFEESKLLKNKIRKSIIREAEIVVTTLSGCGGDIYGVCSDYSSCGKFGSFSEHSLFDAVVIDEAAQALEPATLIPLQLLKSNGTKCVMVGDPKQLPATVLSNLASKHLYECSMFERLQRAGHPVIMLTEQYRMHPEICKFPSCHFYENKLLNGDHTARMTAPFHENFFLGPYLFFDILDGHECKGRKSGSLSLYNEAEAEAVVEILKFFRKRYSSEFLAGRIGLITPYKSQLSVLRSRCNSEFGPSVTGDMEFNTVDGFQGREVDILLLSTVRASDPNARKTAMSSGLIGFVADVRRMNVALTRARLSLWIIGNSRTLQTNFHWTSLIKDAKERDLFISLSRPYKSCLEKPSSLKDKNWSTSLYSHSKHHEQDVMPQGGKPKEGKTKRMNWESEKHKVKHVPGYTNQKISLNADLSSDHQFLKDQKTSASTLRREHTEKLRGKDKVTQRKKFDCADEQCTKRVRSKSTENKSATKVKERKEKTALETVDSSSRNTSQRRSNVPEVCANSHNEKEADHKKNDGDQYSAHKSLIATRKRQREAVDSLLSSSLISSKKSGVSSHVRKPVSQFIDDENSIRPIRPSNAKSTNTKRHFDE